MIKKNEISFSQNKLKLEDIINEMSAPDLDFESMILLYMKGVAIIEVLEEKLSTAELQISFIE